MSWALKVRTEVAEALKVRTEVAGALHPAALLPVAPRGGKHLVERPGACSYVRLTLRSTNILTTLISEPQHEITIYQY